MRTLAVTQNITLDGVIETLTDWFDSADPQAGDQAELAALTREQAARSDALVVGRRTFEDLRGFWPHQHDDTTGVTEHLDRVQKYVVSSTLTDPEWQNSTILRGDVADELAALKDQPGEDIVITGSIRLTHAAIAAGLVDEYRLFLYPVVAGRGRRLFDGAVEIPRLALRDQRTFGTGVVHLTYAAR